MAETYTDTVAELLETSDRDLNLLAAHLSGAVERAAKWWVWTDENGKESAIHISEYKPATDRNQSYGLLRKMVDLGHRFDVQIGGNDPELERVIMWPKLYTMVTIPGNDARTETIAFCAAMLAIQETK